MASPALLVFTIFMFIPLVLTFWYSLNKYSGFGKMQFLGLENYTKIVQDATFWKAAINTVVYTAITVPLGVVLGLSAALLLNRILPARGLFRALFYVPVVISGVASGVIFLRLFDPLTGILNQVAASVGLPTIDWQGNGTAALVSIIIVTTWQGVGFGMVVYLAALQGIPREVYEAGTIDGATGWKRLAHITWPLLAPTTFFLVVYSIIQSFQVFDSVYVLTRGGPGTATTFLVQYAYDEGFNQRRQGYAAAIGVILYVVVLIFTVLQWRLSKTRDEA
ncbi:carbohydrate ABC transporter permease [Segeticoccus rhizosphaerae]|uniref:carbohydrate ABC transporter permease n=1 Tax=Segeticoccus rhizosphaerae TaxID=1104777 RepID=UPI00138FE5E8|nr:sugar ABC transporter permease [Ornithinicoccus soli]